MFRPCRNSPRLLSQVAKNTLEVRCGDTTTSAITSFELYIVYFDVYIFVCTKYVEEICSPSPCTTCIFYFPLSLCNECTFVLVLSIFSNTYDISVCVNGFNLSGSMESMQ